MKRNDRFALSREEIHRLVEVDRPSRPAAGGARRPRTERVDDVRAALPVVPPPPDLEPADL